MMLIGGAIVAVLAVAAWALGGMQTQDAVVITFVGTMVALAGLSGRKGLKAPPALPPQQRKNVRLILIVFTVAAKPLEEGDPAETVHLELTPKADSSYARRFKAIDVFVDPKTHLPARIGTMDKNGGKYRTTDLKNFRLNPGLKDSGRQPAALLAASATEDRSVSASSTVPEKSRRLLERSRQILEYGPSTYSFLVSPLPLR